MELNKHAKYEYPHQQNELKMQIALQKRKLAKLDHSH